MADSRIFAAKDYIAAFRQHYAKFLSDQDLSQNTIDQLHIGVLGEWINNEKSLGEEVASERFVPLASRGFGSDQNAWLVAKQGDVRWAAASRTYKGLLNLKPPFDLVLYSNLIWELQPKTIIEFGALQGGSGLWFADQLDIQCGAGEVHSFELLDKCIHPRAKHPRLHFHPADVRDLKTLDKELFAKLPHPWLIVEDVHENLEELAPYLNSFMVPGDYLILEDIMLSAGATAENINRLIEFTKYYNFLVDTKYTDAFGMNVTCSPNCWFKKF